MSNSFMDNLPTGIRQFDNDSRSPFYVEPEDTDIITLQEEFYSDVICSENMFAEFVVIKLKYPLFQLLMHSNYYYKRCKVLTLHHVY